VACRSDARNSARHIDRYLLSQRPVEQLVAGLAVAAVELVVHTESSAGAPYYG